MLYVTMCQTFSKGIATTPIEMAKTIDAIRINTRTAASVTVDKFPILSFTKLMVSSRWTVLLEY